MVHKITLGANTRVFVVEDARIRIEWFKARLGDIVTGTRPDQALEKLQNGADFDIVFLDHDAQWNDRASTFISVAKRLAELQFPGTVIIHSHNPVGSERMAHMLGKTAIVQIMPFGTFEVARANNPGVS